MSKKILYAGATIIGAACIGTAVALPTVNATATQNSSVVTVATPEQTTQPTTINNPAGDETKTQPAPTTESTSTNNTESAASTTPKADSNKESENTKVDSESSSQAISQQDTQSTTPKTDETNKTSTTPVASPAPASASESKTTTPTNPTPAPAKTETLSNDASFNLTNVTLNYTDRVKASDGVTSTTLLNDWLTKNFSASKLQNFSAPNIDVKYVNGSANYDDGYFYISLTPTQGHAWNSDGSTQTKQVKVNIMIEYRAPDNWTFDTIGKYSTFKNYQNSIDNMKALAQESFKDMKTAYPNLTFIGFNQNDTYRVAQISNGTYVLYFYINVGYTPAFNVETKEVQVRFFLSDTWGVDSISNNLQFISNTIVDKSQFTSDQTHNAPIVQAAALKDLQATYIDWNSEISTPTPLATYDSSDPYTIWKYTVTLTSKTDPKSPAYVVQGYSFARY